MAKVFYSVLDDKRTAVVIQWKGKSVKQVSFDRVADAPASRISEQIKDVVRPLRAAELSSKTLSTSEPLNVSSITTTNHSTFAT